MRIQISRRRNDDEDAQVGTSFRANARMACMKTL
jgi:hypothetical protein